MVTFAYSPSDPLLQLNVGVLPSSVNPMNYISTMVSTSTWKFLTKHLLFTAKVFRSVEVVKQQKYLGVAFDVAVADVIQCTHYWRKLRSCSMDVSSENVLYMFIGFVLIFPLDFSVNGNLSLRNNIWVMLSKRVIR